MTLNQTKNRTVWAVAVGEYSDYGVSYVCATKEIAEELCRRMNASREYDKAKVEEFIFVETLGDPRSSTMFRVEVDSGGTELRRWSYSADDPAGGPEPEDEVITWPPGRVQVGSVRGYDVALKAARDKLASLKAREAGI
jgi:hypothetical protein